MTRVLVTSGVGTIGSAVVRRLLRDPAYDVRVSDWRPAPQWMREGCEVRAGGLLDVEQARAALDGCAFVIHLTGGDGGPRTLIETEVVRLGAIVRAAVDLGVERFAYVSSGLVFERAIDFPTTEAHLPDCPPPQSADGFAALAGEVLCRAAHAKQGLPFTICRPFDAYGPGEQPDAARGVAHLLLGAPEQTRTPTHVDDIADGIVAALSSPAALGEDFNIAAGQELTVAEIARIVGEACGDQPAGAARSWPSVEKARELLGWEALIGAPEGIAQTVARQRERDVLKWAPTS